MTFKRISEFTGLLWLICGTFIIGLLIEFSLGGSRRFLPHFAYVPYFWGFVVSGLLYSYLFKSGSMEKWNGRSKKLAKSGLWLYRFIRDPEGGIYRLDFEETFESMPVAAWKLEEKSLTRLDDRAIVGLLAPGEFTLIVETQNESRK